MGNILVIPDVHGRKFWKEAVKKYPDSDIIFLGDYLDPYPSEEISPEETIANFEEILKFAVLNANCRLLLGNHDLHYLCNFGEACRLDYANSARIHFLLMDNLWLFRLAAIREIDNRKVIFSHAPILTEWIESVGETTEPEAIVNNINSRLGIIARQPWNVERYLGQISVYRGGYDKTGSPVWADVREIHGNLIPTADYSVFGHTQQEADPIITDTWACLDCRKAFLIDDNLLIKPV